MSRKPFFAVIFLLAWLSWPSAGAAQSQLNISREFAYKKVDSPKYLDDLCGDLKITGGTGWLFIEMTVSPYKKGKFKIYRGVQATLDGLYIDCGPYYLPDIRLDDSRSLNELEPKQSVDGQPSKWTRKMKIGRNLKPFTMKFCMSGTYWDWRSMQLAQTVEIKAFWFEGENDPGNPLSTSPASANLTGIWIGFNAKGGNLGENNITQAGKSITFVHPNGQITEGGYVVDANSMFVPVWGSTGIISADRRRIDFKGGSLNGIYMIRK